MPHDGVRTKQFMKLVRFHGADLMFTDAAITEIAKVALERGTGARGQRERGRIWCSLIDTAGDPRRIVAQWGNTPLNTPSEAPGEDYVIVRNAGPTWRRQAVHVIDDQVWEPEVDAGQDQGVGVVGLALIRQFEEAHLVPLADVLATTQLPHHPAPAFDQERIPPDAVEAADLLPDSDDPKSTPLDQGQAGGVLGEDRPLERPEARPL